MLIYPEFSIFNVLNKIFVMRFQLTLRLTDPVRKVLPCNYVYELSAVLYKILNEGDINFAAWLHDLGYCKGKKAFKLFTFSNLYAPRYEIKGDRFHILAGMVKLKVSFFPIEAMEVFVVGLFRNRSFILGDYKSQVPFEITEIESLPEPEFSSSMRFKTLSPIFIEEQFPDSSRTLHLSPNDPKFVELLHMNLLEKYRAFYGKEPNPDWRQTQLRLLSAPKAKTIALKAGTPQETKMRGYLFQFELKGEPELLKLGYDGGFGRLNSQGFGCVEIMS